MALLMDEDVLKAEYFGCHPCVNTSSLRLRISDVFGAFLEAVGHDYQVIGMQGGPCPVQAAGTRD